MKMIARLANLPSENPRISGYVSGECCSTYSVKKYCCYVDLFTVIRITNTVDALTTELSILHINTTFVKSQGIYSFI